MFELVFNNILFLEYNQLINFKLRCRGLVNEQKEYFVFCIRHNAVRDDGWKDHLQLICIAVSICIVLIIIDFIYLLT